MTTLNFKGKSVIREYHLSVPFRRLTPNPKKSLTESPGLHDNLIVHGDNLSALKSLLPAFGGKIKCIYIDPPYNTGSENWVYNDNVNSPIHQDWLKKAVDREDLTRHEKWLCMMWPRLVLLRELLTEDGLIFVSIDDNEFHRLRAIMDEIFGEECFKNAVIFRRGAKNVQAQFDTVASLTVGHEYVLVYSRTPETRLRKLEIPRSDGRSKGAWNNHWRGTDRPTMRYELFGITPKTGQWRWSQTRSMQALDNYRRIFADLGRTEKTLTQEEIDRWYAAQGDEPDLLRLSSNGKPEHYVPPSDTKLGSDLWADLGTRGSSELIAIFGSKVFDNPKPVALVKRIIKLTTNPNDLVLDSFAGSGTTAQAVMELNAEDGGARKFILIEQEDYADSVTAERVRRVITGVKQSKDKTIRNGLGGSFTYYELGEALPDKNL